MSRKREEACLFCGCSPCECNGPVKKKSAPRKKPAVAKVKPPPPTVEPKVAPKPVRKKQTISAHAIAFHRALEAFAEQDMLRPDTYRTYPDIHPPRGKNVKRR